MRRLAAVVLLFSSVAGVSSCASGRVVVTDVSGVPISGAKVYAVSPSMNSAPDITDSQGRARVPTHIGQEVQWIDVRATGYEGAFVDVPESWPLMIKLSMKGGNNPAARPSEEEP